MLICCFVVHDIGVKTTLLLFQLVQNLKRLMRPYVVEFKSPLELSAQGEYTHTLTLAQ